MTTVASASAKDLPAGSRFRELLPKHRPALILAPMQDVTHLPFWTVIHPYGGPDVYFTEYFRVHSASTPQPPILRALDENPTGKPVMAQMIGREIPHLIRTTKLLATHPIAGIDLNLGCPAPIVCRKDSGGGLLRDLNHIDSILGALREATPHLAFTVKTRVGFDCHTEFEALLEVFARHEIDGLSVHGRTVQERYRTPIHYEQIRMAVERLDCPVIANGNIVSLRMARKTLDETGADGLMIGRGAIRSPWLFEQLRAAFDPEHHAAPLPVLRDVLQYVRELHAATRADDPKATDNQHTCMMKRFMNFIAHGLSPDDQLLNGVRRCNDSSEFWKLCEKFLDNDRPLPAEPPATSGIFAGLTG
jgi:tRNA-dihydrouridine synthase